MSWSSLCTEALENPMSLRMLVKSLHQGTGKPSIPEDASAACSTSWGPVPMGAHPSPQPGACPCPFSSHRGARLARAGRTASLHPTELPGLTHRLSQTSAQRLRRVRQDLISASPTRCPVPGRLRRAAFVCGARRQTAAGKRPSITAPSSLSPQNKGRKKGWQL